MDVWSVMSLMWIRLRPRASFPMKQSEEILQHFTPCLLSSAHHPLTAICLQVWWTRRGRVGGQTTFRWSLSAGLSFDVRRTGCLIAPPRTDESVCLYFTSACHCRVNLSSNCPCRRINTSRRQHCSTFLPNIPRPAAAEEEEEVLRLLLVPCFGTGTDGQSGFLLHNMLHPSAGLFLLMWNGKTAVLFFHCRRNSHFYTQGLCVIQNWIENVY